MIGLLLTIVINRMGWYNFIKENKPALSMQPNLKTTPAD